MRGYIGRFEILNIGDLPPTCLTVYILRSRVLAVVRIHSLDVVGFPFDDLLCKVLENLR